MTAPFDPEEFDPEGTNRDGCEDDVLGEDLGEDLGPWDADDQLFDLMLRERIGQVPHLPTPPHAFERVLVAGRRHRARKVWAVGAAAALVVLAGTAGTTVVLRGTSTSNNSALPPAVAVSHATTPDPGPAVTASPSPGATGNLAGTLATASTSASTTASASTPQCHSDDLQLTVSVQFGGNNLADLLIALRNNSGHPCTIYGYAADLQTETKAGQPQNTKIVQQGQEEFTEVTLAQGQSASTLAEITFGATDSTSSSDASCNAPSYYLAVTPPNEQTQLVAPITGGPVSLCGANHIIDSLPFTAGATG